MSPINRMLLVLLALAFVCASSPVQAQWPPEKTTNLQVFPKETPVRELLSSMKGFTFALGVRCTFCHVGEPDQPITSIDFASDDNEHKEKARVMLRMVSAINGEHLPKLGVEAEELVRVRCVTCHRGQSRPRMIQDVVQEVVMEDGADAAVDKYRELREEYYGSHTFDFSAAPLNGLAERLAHTDRLDEAASLLELNLEFHSDDFMGWHLLGEVQLRQDDESSAIESFERSLELNPQNERAQQRLDELEDTE